MIPVVRMEKYTLFVSDLDIDRDGKNQSVEGIVCMDDDGEEITLNMRDEPNYHKAVKEFQAEEGKDDGKEVVLHMLHASVGAAPKIEWEFVIDKIETRAAE